MRISRVWHILASPGYAPRTIAVNVTRLERGFNVCKMPLCIYPSVFNRFPVIQAGSLKLRHFSTFFCTFWPPWETVEDRWVYMPSIVTMAVSAAILEIFNVKEWPDLEIWV